MRDVQRALRSAQAHKHRVVTTLRSSPHRSALMLSLNAALLSFLALMSCALSRHYSAFLTS